MFMIRKIYITKGAQKSIRACPKHVVIKFMAWVADVELRGLEEVRKVPGFHDEPLKGNAEDSAQLD
jgi:proteic killer suppression protein